MSTHYICFRGEIRKNVDTFGLKKKKSILSRAMCLLVYSMSPGQTV